MTVDPPIVPSAVPNPVPLPAPGGPPTIEVPGTGPLRVRGLVRVVDAMGNVLREADRFSLCGCGKSATKPFCDGSHKPPPPPAAVPPQP